MGSLGKSLQSQETLHTAPLTNLLKSDLHALLAGKKTNNKDAKAARLVKIICFSC